MSPFSVRVLLCLALAGLLPGSTQGAVPTLEGEEGLSWLGQEYHCVRRAGEGRVQSEEYLPTGETFGDWRQCVLVRRIAVGGGFDPEAFVGRFKAELARNAGARIEDCGRNPGGRVLLVDDRAAAPGERVLSCVLVLYSPEEGLVLLQYSQRPGRLDQVLADLQMKAWRERLLAQAGGAPGAGTAQGASSGKVAVQGHE